MQNLTITFNTQPTTTVTVHLTQAESVVLTHYLPRVATLFNTGKTRARYMAEFISEEIDGQMQRFAPNFKEDHDGRPIQNLDVNAMAMRAALAGIKVMFDKHIN